LNTNLKIQRSNLDGTNVEDLVTSGLSIPRHIAATTVPEASTFVLMGVGVLIVMSKTVRNAGR
jgi:hypothetical protein